QHFLFSRYFKFMTTKIFFNHVFAIIYQNKHEYWLLPANKSSTEICCLLCLRVVAKQDIHNWALEQQHVSHIYNPLAVHKLCYHNTNVIDSQSITINMSIIAAGIGQHNFLHACKNIEQQKVSQIL
ncbi:hypothetical protein ACJX0J_016066, partial [Zea mays]